MTQKIYLEIEQLVLKNFDPDRNTSIRAELERQLAGLLRDHAPNLAGKAGLRIINLGDIRLTQQQSRHALEPGTIEAIANRLP